MTKRFIDSNQLMKLSMKLGKSIYESDYRPDIIIGVSRGGCTPSIIVHEFLSYKNINCLYGIISTKSYDDNNNKLDRIEIDVSNALIEKLKKCDNILIIDDVLDTGYTFRDIGKYLLKNNVSSNTFTFASIYYKPSKNQTTIVPKFYVKETDEWIVFPHELLGLTFPEVETKMNYML
tara:strand:- start:249 stop:779 length:531 start_codon:yes stop_codon:yes gene_type:complete